MKNLYLLGDSISIGYGPALAASLQGAFMVRRKGGGVWDAVGREDDLAYNGRDSGALLSFLDSTRPKADLFLFNCGLHDIKTAPGETGKQVPLERYGSNLKKIAEIIKSLSKEALWISTTPVIDRLHNSRSDGGAYRCNADVTAYNAAAAGIMEEAGIPIADLYSFTLPFGEKAYRDHVHFTPEIYRRQGEFLASAVFKQF